jgi:hypothetical protein
MRALPLLAVLIAGPAGADEIFRYKAEWRLMHAGNIVLRYSPGGAHMTLETVGMVSSLYRVNDDYRVQFRGGTGCSESILFQIEEGKRRNEARATFPAKAGKSSYLETDTIKKQTVRTAELDVPACVHDVIGALAALRAGDHPKGAEFTMPVSDGRKFAQVKVHERGRERVKTEAGEFQAVKYEADLMNGVIYRRAGRMFFWLSDDARRLPLRVRMQMSFFFGTVTIDLVKEERS